MAVRRVRLPVMPGRQDGMSLVEVLVATAVLTTVIGGVAHLIVSSRRVVWRAGVQSRAVWLAEQKLEQLRALEWRTDAAGIPRSDLTSNLSLDPIAGDDGSGLQASPADVLDRNVGGFADFLGADGQWLGRAPDRVAGAAFVRRWSIAAYPADPADTVILTVVVFPAVDAEGRRVRPSEARLQTILTRTRR